MVRRWRRQREELSQCKKSKKAFRGNKSRWPELEDFLEDWVNTQRADGRGVSTVQIRLKAKTVATEMKSENFRGGPSWCFRFMRRKGLSIRARTTGCQQLPPDYQEKLTNFGEFTQRKMEEYSIGPDQIINMDEVPLTFDLPLTRTVNKKGESSITLRTTGHERTNFTCVLGCTASGLKLPPMAIFKRITMPKEKIPNGISFKVNKKGWMMESVMKEWLNECYVKRPGGFSRQKKALLVLDSMRAHITDSVKAAIKSTNSIPAVIPGGTTKHLQPLDISVNRATYQGVKLLYSFGIFITFALQFYVPAEILIPPVLARVSVRWERPVDMLLRTVLVLFTCALAILIPELDLVISFVGSVSSSFLALIFPPILQILTFHTEGLSPLVTIKNAAISLIGLIGFITGTYIAIEKIIERNGLKSTEAFSSFVVQ
ncbi:hypothetical protein JOQ06_023101 [Pogonophryne albipinna]|uniref:HTH CENPB-type domain-containing protein n=1 Tax=Pogonophryne albipinna TaxID=1090488 RepID=A0AAD6BKJ4_9TELE|nr:hypothetical protein JOQ06_023101 [Pogonophryne albipinna]